MGKIRQLHEGKRIVYTSGSFDILHIGHIYLLNWAKQQGNILVVGLNSDEIIRQKKGEARPIIPLDNRLTTIDALRAVDYAVAVDGDSGLMPWIDLGRRVRPDICVLGPDWGHLELAIWKRSFAGAEVLISPPRLGPSTSELIAQIRMKSSGAHA
jgi:rfaE bifunctional protein nucleotidyltransferase chain/domain